MGKTTTKKFETEFNEMNNEISDKKEFPFEPSKDVINRILNYSKALSIRKTTGGDTIEMLLN